MQGESKGSKVAGLVALVAGIALVAAALVLAGRLLFTGAGAEDVAEQVVAALDDAKPSADEKPLASWPAVTGIEMPVHEVDGVSYLGVISWSDARLPLAASEGDATQPWRYDGSAYDGELVVACPEWCGADGLSLGDVVGLTDADGNVFSYTVASLEQLATGSSIESGWALVLYVPATGLLVCCEAA